MILTDVEWVHSCSISPCFRVNVVVTCKLGSFVCSLDNVLQKNVILFFFENQISKWRSFAKKKKKKKGNFLPTFHIFKLPGKVTKIPSGTYLTHIHTSILLTLFFCLTNFEKKYEFIRYGFSLV